MDFFINNAWAQAAPAPGGSGMANIIFIVVMFAVFWFILIRPQMKQQKEHKNMVSALAKGDEVVSAGGILGKITKIGDNFVELEIADNVVIKIQKNSISNVLPKGTLKTM